MANVSRPISRVNAREMKEMEIDGVFGGGAQPDVAKRHKEWWYTANADGSGSHLDEGWGD